MAENYHLDPQRGSWTELNARIKSSRIVIIAALALTVLNTTVSLLGLDLQLLYSMTVPYYFVLFGKGMDNHFAPGSWTEVGIYTRTGLVLGLGFFALAVLFWALSFRNRNWMKGFLALMVVDLLALLLLSFLGLGGVLDVLTHGLLVWQALSGMRAEADLEGKRRQYLREMQGENEKQEPADAP